MKQTTARPPEFRVFVKEFGERLYNFCYYMVGEENGAEELALETFREFGGRFRRKMAGITWEPLEARVSLFGIAWRNIREHLESKGQQLWAMPPNGRDTRLLKEFDLDLLAKWDQSDRSERAIKKIEQPFVGRISRVDPEQRAAVVLKDMLKFDDEEITRILAVRWGIHRHRLHRGRISLCESLRGSSNEITAELQSRNKAR
ncbi:MAG: hypothetical protein HY537_11670 [Deltaproteobacteria bacterium]|nr:hypothetical protein [Deltaproteobacteria bacterium]